MIMGDCQISKHLCVVVATPQYLRHKIAPVHSRFPSDLVRTFRRDRQRVQALDLEQLLERIVDEAMSLNSSLPSNLSLTISTVKWVSPEPPPIDRIAEWWECEAESFEMERWEGEREVVN
ncbi:BQ5605_C029g10643 [Microbotryum silenes-dioicae]|uniref:BQ5605_C029g10643 protein n=1 Tax=Microbotryum silenes-dioicae TaxID=796604 RepID=A0A2X0MJ49_9BASI|nr:BQ5605_C029g10643 [Microbotryum silenes-dioicae]